MEEDLKKMEDDLKNKNKMEHDLKKYDGRQPQAPLQKNQPYWL
jgi:hypothetical protein